MAGEKAMGSFLFVFSVINLSVVHIFEVKEAEDMKTAEVIWEMLRNPEGAGIGVQEIRIRVDRPVLIRRNGEEEVTEYIAEPELMKELLGLCSRHSLYAFEDELSQGFLTMEGGHRIGIAGKAVMSDGKVRTIKEISGMNIRMAKEYPGCADSLIPWLYDRGEVQSTLLISPPGAGKTTMLRDVIRQLSNGTKYGSGETVAVVDERSELASCFRGRPQCDLGMRTDVMTGCPKSAAMNMMIRSMAPTVAAVDEIGTAEELESMRNMMKCGCKILATVHGSCVEDLMKKRVLREMVTENLFERYVVLTRRPHPGTVQGIFDGQFRCLSQNKDVAECGT